MTLPRRCFLPAAGDFSEVDPIENLTVKQKRFVDAYLADPNATKAALDAGYSKKTAYAIGSENLKKPEIITAIDVGKRALAAKLEFTREKQLQKYEQVIGGATDEKQYGAVNTAISGQNKMLGFEIPDTGAPTQVNIALGETELARRLAVLIQNGANALDP